MKKATIGKHVIEYYDAIEDLPIRRYHKYNKMLLIDAGIGGDLFDADGHIERAMRFVAVGDAKSAQTELVNLRHNLYLMQTEMSPKFRAFAALIASVDGETFEDFTDDGITAILAKIQDLSVADVTATLEAVKKKISTELKAYFAKMYESADIKEYFDLMKARTMSVLEAIVNEKDNADRIDDLTTRLVTYSKPNEFQGDTNAEILCDKDFETMCHVITENIGTNAKNLSVMEFYTAYEYTKDKIKAKEKACKAK